MADDDLAQIRKARLEQLKSQGGGGGGGGGQEAQQQRQMQASTFLISPEARQSILDQILEREAADRLGRIRLVNQQRATDVENRLITLARSGALRGAVTEDQLKELLNAVAEKKEEEKIVVSRRKSGWDDEDDDLFDM
ncbi:PDCD5-related protein [Amylocarpus encephaloides]|uniref:PDCD5-related protein n=1 Tax=Amylocarpus encephaloides TaxID=45428 RepID=A0A9P7Y8L2_9HELO|nr:PDCD5-related protein [Amylocarpus encephaloides]